ncbi:MAG: DUF6273 domain-containing protein [Phascolarctobacterium sp.]|nr:DUF6273 domain-containing protein [Phascolarctobacterium sp.]
MIKFNLYCDGQPIRSLEDLRENFNIDDIYEDYQSGQLVKWLQSRNYEREYIQIERINSKDKKAICDKLCVIFGVAGTNVERPRDLNESDIEKRFLKLEKDVSKLLQKVNDLERVIKDIGSKCNGNFTAGNTNMTKIFYLGKSNINVGDIIKFGKYKQRGNGKSVKDAIEWQVLAVERKRALLISRYGLDAIGFNDVPNNKWTSCNLRSWLNVNFVMEAFSKEETERIATTKVEAGVGDKLFLLSVDEVYRYFKENNVRKCKETDYAKQKGVSSDGKNCCWWLRSAGAFKDTAVLVRSNGSVNAEGYRVLNDNICVRPAMWVNI